MKLHLMSDLHLDHDKKSDDAFLASLVPQPDVDALVLAGDWYSVCRPDATATLFARLLELYDQILVVPGNHEMWRSSPDEANKAIVDAIGSSTRIHAFIEPGYKTIKGQEFFGGTLWYRKPQRRQQQDFVDMDQINCPREWFFEQQRLFQVGLYEGFPEGKTLEDTIVISHHLPSPQSTPLKFKGTSSDHFFMCNMSGAIMDRKPKLWVHGHTHEPCDYVMGSTRVVCHPRGYPHEIRSRSPYQPLLIEVP